MPVGQKNRPFRYKTPSYSLTAYRARHDSSLPAAVPRHVRVQPGLGAPLLTDGLDLGYRRDIEGKQSKGHIGAYGAARLRAA